jgi:chromosome segregation ATPase
MKSLLLAPALVSFVNTDQLVEPVETKPIVIELVAIASVEDPPIVELAPLPEFVPVVVKEVDADRVQGLREDLEELAASLRAIQGAVENVAQQRDQARDEVRALAMANHEMLKEMKAFRHEMEMARKETEQWKNRADEMEKRANDQALANAEMQKFRAELQGAMNDFRAMRDDIATVRGELQDPIERADLKEQLAEAAVKQNRLSDEIEMALIAREKTILEAARTRKELEGKMATLMRQAHSAKEMRDELRTTNAVKMKALADVEVLRKQLQRSEDALEATAVELEVAQDGNLALQAEKAAAVESRMVAHHERDEARSELGDLEEQVEEVRRDAEDSNQAVAEVTEELKEAEMAREATGQELVEASGALDKVQEEVVFLNKAKGGLEELLFRKTAEIRKLKGELRKMHASREKSSKPPKSPTPNDPEKGKEATAQALAD